MPVGRGWRPGPTVTHGVWAQQPGLPPGQEPQSESWVQIWNSFVEPVSQIFGPATTVCRYAPAIGWPGTMDSHVGGVVVDVVVVVEVVVVVGAAVVVVVVGAAVVVVGGGAEVVVVVGAGVVVVAATVVVVGGGGGVVVVVGGVAVVVVAVVVHVGSVFV